MRKVYVSLLLAVALGLSSPAVAQEGEAVTVPMRERGGSGASGEATLTESGDGATTVRIDVEGAPPGPWPAQIGEGDCGSAGPPVFDLNPVRDGESATDVGDALEDILAGDYYISMDLTDPTITPAVVCGEIEAATGGAASVDGDATAPEDRATAAVEATPEADVTARVDATREAGADGDPGADAEDQRGEMPGVPGAGGGATAGANLPLGGATVALCLLAAGAYTVWGRR